jgi:hypothetical protein
MHHVYTPGKRSCLKCCIKEKDEFGALARLHVRLQPRQPEHG